MSPAATCPRLAADPAGDVETLAAELGAEHREAAARVLRLRSEAHAAREHVRTLGTAEPPTEAETVAALLAGNPAPQGRPRGTPSEVEAARERHRLTAKALGEAERLEAEAAARLAERVCSEVRPGHRALVGLAAEAVVGAMQALEALGAFQAELDAAAPGWERHLGRVGLPSLSPDPGSPAARWLAALAEAGLLDRGSIPADWRARWHLI